MANILKDMVFTVGETSKILKSNTNTVYKLIREGKLHALKLGRYKVPYFEIERFLKENLDQDLSEFVC
ncbi:transcriptional regulator [Clostridium sp. K25]|uniref:Transcriptional regulator n=1 Tax=Clostridium novyi B str. ATCC 27606 TaxID=1443123 RepID=A0AA40IVX7_CLONO|nr:MULTISPECIES: helix-turn-helix domain-containing protein [Clostridium]KEI10823.1 transcriptional regulator [Clostridium sp. K25]KEI17784.1 transcriptional regulator [Clostridium novyi B str. ATCC 27606]